MRLARGTVVVICGNGGCIERTITDYGPSAKSGRVIDLYRPDFFLVCGCQPWSGTTEVTIKVYGSRGTGATLLATFEPGP